MSTHVSVPLYRYRGHAIKPLSSPVWGTCEGGWHWLVCPDSGAPSWYAHSLADAREVIDLAALGELDIEAARAEGRAPLRDHPEVESGGGLMEAPLPLYRYDDIYDAAADAVGCIDARLHRRGLQLEPAASEALRQTLEGILRLMRVEFLDNEGNPIDPIEQHRPEVE